MLERNKSNHLTKRRYKVLRIDSSARMQDSITRELGDLLVKNLVSQDADVEVAMRDVAPGLPFLSEEWVNANFTNPDLRSERQREVLSLSDMLVDELIGADVIVIGAPMYNFGIPATLKAWIDMVARVGRTFRYGENGPIGLLSGKKAYLIVASGGTPIGSSIDFATNYLIHVLAFIGIDDVEVIRADSLRLQGDDPHEQARKKISEISLNNLAQAA